MQLIRKAPVLHVVVSLIAILSLSAVALALKDESHRYPNSDSGVAPAIATAAIDAHKSVEVRFSDGSSDETPDFQKHVAPLLGRLGCNGRACHGSFQGQGGFRLSLFGYDFESDHQALLEDGADRVDLITPQESLILTKPTNEDDHEGGLRYEVGSWQFNLLKAWIVKGGKTPDSIHQLDQLVIEPAEIQLSDPARKVELKATAHWADGTKEDVTPLCRFHSNDDSIAKISESGLVSTETIAGDTHVVISYDSAVVPVPVIHPYQNHSVDIANKIQTPSKIDELVARKWAKLNIAPSELSNDAMFLRRVSIDIAGTLPSPDEIRDFLDSADPKKRENKIDELLETPAYAAWWTTFLCDMTENNTLQLRNISYDNNIASQQWYDWIYRRVETNVPYDEIVEGIVLGVDREPDESYLQYCERMTKTASSLDFADSQSMPYYWMRREFRERDTRAISFAHAFLGLRIQCAQCHKHPFDQWSQNDFKEFSGFFAGVTSQSYNQGRTPQDKQDYAQILKNLSIEPDQKNNGKIRKQLTEAYQDGKTTPFGYLAVHSPKPTKEELKDFSDKVKAAKKKDRKAKLAKPELTHARLLGGDQVNLSQYDDIREPVMQWMRRPENPFFAKALVNRVWAGYFGVGIVDPADDLNLANPPSNAPLLDYLAKQFVEHDFDMKWLHREIANSRTYQLSWVPNETNQHDRRNFSRALPRRLPAEVVFDAVASAASNAKTNRSYREVVGDRAISIPGTASNNKGKKKTGTDSAFALKVFGRSERASSCDCDRSDETSLIQTVYMQNDRDIHTMLTRNDSWVNQMAVRHRVDPKFDSLKKQLSSLTRRLAALEKTRSGQEKNGNDRQVQKLEKQIRGLNKNIQPLQKKLDVADSQKQEMNIEEVVTEAYLRTLSRYPSTDEITRCVAHIREDKDLINGVTGVLWALVNTKEFIVNH